jgi:hypothetical protein
MADNRLTAEDQEYLHEAFERVESEEIAERIHEKYHEMAHRLARLQYGETWMIGARKRLNAWMSRRKILKQPYAM